MFRAAILNWECSTMLRWLLRRSSQGTRPRSGVLGVRVAIYLAAEKWDMAAAVANHLVKVEPENSGWWINLAYAKRRCEGIESAEAILLRARELHHDNAMIEFNLACYASVAGRFEEAKNGSNAPSNWKSIFKRSLLMTRTCGPYGIGLLTCSRMCIAATMSRRTIRIPPTL